MARTALDSDGFPIFTAHHGDGFDGRFTVAPKLAAPVTPVAAALDADGEDFTLDFGFGAMPAGKAHIDRKAADPVEAALATETVANHFRAEALKLA